MPYFFLVSGDRCPTIKVSGDRCPTIKVSGDRCPTSYVFITRCSHLSNTDLDSLITFSPSKYKKSSLSTINVLATFLPSSCKLGISDQVSATKGNQKVETQ